MKEMQNLNQNKHHTRPCVGEATASECYVIAVVAPEWGHEDWGGVVLEIDYQKAPCGQLQVSAH